MDAAAKKRVFVGRPAPPPATPSSRVPWSPPRRASTGSVGLRTSGTPGATPGGGPHSSTAANGSFSDGRQASSVPGSSSGVDPTLPASADEVIRLLHPWFGVQAKVGGRSVQHAQPPQLAQSQSMRQQQHQQQHQQPPSHYEQPARTSQSQRPFVAAPHVPPQLPASQGVLAKALLASDAVEAAAVSATSGTRAAPVVNVDAIIKSLRVLDSQPPQEWMTTAAAAVAARSGAYDVGGSGGGASGTAIYDRWQSDSAAAVAVRQSVAQWDQGGSAYAPPVPPAWRPGDDFTTGPKPWSEGGVGSALDARGMSGVTDATSEYYRRGSASAGAAAALAARQPLSEVSRNAVVATSGSGHAGDAAPSKLGDLEVSLARMQDQLTRTHQQIQDLRQARASAPNDAMVSQ